MYTSNLRFEHGAHMRPFDQPLEPQTPAPDDNMAALDTASIHHADRSQFRASGMPDVTTGTKLIGVRDQRTLYYAVDSTNPWPSQVPLHPRKPSASYTSAGKSHSSESSTHASGSNSSESKASRTSGSPQSRWHQTGKSQALNESSARPRRKLRKRSKPTTPSKSKVEPDAKSAESGRQAEPEPVDTSNDTRSSEESAAERDTVRSVISTSDYDYEHHAKSRFSWLPFQKKRNQKREEKTAAPASTSPALPSSSEPDAVTRTQPSAAREVHTSSPPARPSTPKPHPVHTPQLATILEVDTPADSSSIYHDAVEEQEEPDSNSNDEDNNDPAPFEQPFWDVNDNLSSRRRDAFDALSEARDLLFPHEGGSVPNNTERRPRNPVYVALRPLRSVLMTYDTSRPPSPVQEGSEPESGRSTPEVLEARIQQVKSIEMTPEKVQELMERRLKEQGPDAKEVPGIPAVLVTNTEGHGRSGRVDSVMEEEENMLNRTDKKEELRAPSFM